MASRCSIKLVSKKIRKIRWKPVLQGSIQKPDVFITGSWQNEPNSISVWQLNSSETNEEMFIESDPVLLHEITHAGDVTDFKYLNPELFIASSSVGKLSLFKHMLKQEPHLQMTWDKMHHFKVNSAPCTGLDSHGDSFVSVGEDGRLIQYNIKNREPVRIIDADSGTLTAVTYLKQNEIITSNSQGQLALWDLRCSEDEPTRIMSMGGELAAVLSMSHHPTQPSILACGNEDGSLCIWDLRQHQYPATILSAHNGPVLEIRFHPLFPNHLFTCSMDGMIWHWDSSALANPAVMSTRVTGRRSVADTSNVTSSPWVACGASKHLEICSLLPSSNKPINSLDIHDDVLVCGSDNEAFYIISNLNL